MSGLVDPGSPEGLPPGTLEPGPGGPGSASFLAPHDASALWMSFVIIFVSEIGDKTFMIGAVLAMRHPRLLIWTASMAALGIMTVLSALLGLAVPNLISRHVTQLLVAVLFVVFGASMAWEAWKMTGGEAAEELEDASKEVAEKEQLAKADLAERGAAAKGPRPGGDSLLTIRPNGGTGIGAAAGASSPPASPAAGGPPRGLSSRLRAAVYRGRRLWQRSSVKNLVQFLFSPIFIQTFIMMFLAEWGDRSQIATIALAGAQGFWWVTIGALAAHSICTGIAVVGGRLIATKISVRSVTIIGAGLFIIFGCMSFFEARYGNEEDGRDPY